MVGTWRNLFIEFGAAEVLDSGVIRPAAMALGVRWLGVEAGIAAGKVAADTAFYGPLILTYEIRRRLSAARST